MTTAAIAEFRDLPLLPHPACAASPLHALSVSGTLSVEGLLKLDYLLHGDLQGMRLPPVSPSPHRRDELWRHTCLELFARRDDEQSYLEFNFSPSGDWAAYRFDACRQGQKPWLQQPVSVALLPPGGAHLLIQAQAQLPAGATAGWRLGPAAVIESCDGSLSYWATRHPSAQPDFHAAAGFTVALSSPARAARATAAAP